MSNFGTNVVIGAKASRLIVIESQTPIFIVGTVVLSTLTAGTDKDGKPIVNKDLQAKIKENDGLLFYGKPDDAKADFVESTGTLRNVLDGITDQNVSTKLIIAVVSITKEQSEKKTPEEFYDTPAIKSNIIKAIAGAKTATALYGTKSNLLIAPRFSHDLDVKAELESVASSLSATAIVDLNATDEADATVKMKNYGSKRLLVCDPYVKVWDTKLDKTITEPSSARVAGMIAHTDGLKEYGWADIPSNQVMQGISGTSRVIEFIYGQECEADRLRTLGITTIINIQGFRLWGFDTTDQDFIWKSLQRVRIFDRVADAVLKGLFWAIDKRADQLIYAKESAEGLLRSLKGANVLVGYEVFWHPEKNTKEALTAGKFYLVADFQNMPTVNRLEIECNFVDKHSGVLMKMIGA